MNLKKRILQSLSDFFDNTVIDMDKILIILGELSKRDITSFRYHNRQEDISES